MENVSKEESINWKIGLKIGLKTFVACFIGIMFIISSIFVLFPKMSLKINNALGFVKLKELNYQMIYDRSDKITDLYNVIVCEGELEKYSKELEYIDEMLKREDYDEFCSTMDKASLKSVSDKSMIPYSVNVNGYLMSRKVICMYNLSINGIDSYIYRQAGVGKLAEYSFSTYVDLVYEDDSLTDAQKREKLSFLMEMFDVSGIELSELVEKRIENINNNLKIEKNVEKQIALQYTLVRIYRSRYYIYEALGDESKKIENKTAYETAKTNLNNMINL